MASAQSPASLRELKTLTVEEQTCFLLRRLARLEGSQGGQGFHRGNLRLPGIMLLAEGFPEAERLSVTDALLAAPWQRLVNEGFISDNGQNFFYLTPEGRLAAAECEKTPKRPMHRMAVAALALLHPDFRSFAHYFREGRLKEAVAAAFERYENRLNEIRDERARQATKAVAGQALVYALFREGLLVVPYRQLASENKPDLEKSLQGVMSGALGWIRNPFAHEKHHIPEIDEEQALELLFFASYLMRLVEAAARASETNTAQQPTPA